MAHTVSRIISDETLNRIIQIESGGRPTAKARTSSATGLGQFVDKTWLTVIARHRPDLAAGKSRREILELRKDPHISIELLARLTEDNAALLPNGYGDGDLYLAHFAGVSAARKLLRAPASASASNYFTGAAVRANRSILSGKTVSQVRSWAHRKMKAAGKTNWVAKYYRPSVPGEHEIEPDPPVAPLPPDIEPVEPETPKKKSWLRRVGEWFTGAGGFSIFAYLTDPQVVLAIGGVALIAFLIWWFLLGGRKWWKK